MAPIDQTDESDLPSRSRLNLLLSAAERRQDTILDQLPCLLAPMGIQIIRVGSGTGAARVISDRPIHIAVVDMLVPLGDDPASGAGGARVLQLLRRLDQPPPTVVIRPRQAVARESARGLAAALREGAFAVLDQPIHLEALLQVMRRIIHRHYADVWPA
jgi:DNA-binding NtrC family response regulator